VQAPWHGSWVEMTPAATIASVVLVLGETWLVVTCWHRRSVLGAACGVVGIALVPIAILSQGRGAGAQALAGSLAALIIGTVLLRLGQAVQRLLDEEPDMGP
jgi:hypothetical protein